MVTRAKSAFPARAETLSEIDPLPSHELIDPQQEEDDFEESATDRVATMIRAHNGDDRAILKVFRVIGPNKYSACCDYSITEFEDKSYSLIRRDWGAGEFQIRLYGVHPQRGNFGVLAKENINIEKMLSEPASQSQPSVPSELATVLASMADAQNRMLAALTERPAPVDPMAQMMQMFTLMKTMKEALGPSENTGKSNISEIVQAMREMREVSEEFGPKAAEPQDPLLAALPGMMELIKGAQKPAEAPIQFAPVSLPPMVAAQSLATSDPQAHQQAITDASANAQLDLPAMLRQLVTMAKANVAPEDVAPIVYQMAPDELFTVLRDPTWFDALSGFMPEAGAFKAWFIEVGKQTLAIFDAPEENEAVK